MQNDLDFFKGFIETPPLWEGIQFGIQQFEFPKVDLSDFKIAAIPSNIRLGHQVEHVFRQLLLHDNTYDILLYNTPVRANKTTIGEIDFLLKKKSSQQIVHVELTYKFYILNTSNIEPLQQLSGANRLDLFSKKLEKIKTKQFPLLHRPETLTILKEHDITISTNLSHQVCFKAQLFVPYTSFDYTPIIPINPSCIIGQWLSIAQFKGTDFHQHSYYIPSKRERILVPQESANWESHPPTYTQLINYMSQEKSVLLWQRRSATDFKKFFVVWWS